MARRPIFETLSAEAAQLELKRRIDQDRAHAAAYHEKQTGSGKTRYSRYVKSEWTDVLDEIIRGLNSNTQISGTVMEKLYAFRKERHDAMVAAQQAAQTGHRAAPMGGGLAASHHGQASGQIGQSTGQ